MAWPRRIYVATTVMGVYYTENFTDPAVQPTWTAVNTGLPTTDCREFHLDPFNNAVRQYVMLDGSRTLYRREDEGAWAAILTAADVGALTGRTSTPSGFCTDDSVDGRLWVCFHNPWNATNAQYQAVYSDDYGDSWTLSAVIYSSDWNYTYGMRSVRASGDNVWVPLSTGVGGGARMYYSSNKGVAWGSTVLDINNLVVKAAVNPLLTTLAYCGADWATTDDLAQVTNGGARTDLQAGLALERFDVMWFHPTDSTHQRIIDNDRLYVTNDTWGTESDAGQLISGAGDVISIAPWAGADTDQIILGLTINHAGGHDEIIGVIYGEGDTTVTLISGSMSDSAPYTDSIPYTGVGLAIGGIRAIDAPGEVHTYAVSMPGYDGTARGTPIQGDRSAWDVLTQAARHASDILAAALLRHLPAPAADGNYARDDGTNWQATAGGIPLADLLDYVQGYIIRGGAVDWEAYDASGDGFVLIGDGTDVESRALVTADFPDPVAFNASTELTIAAGEITATQTYHSVDTADDDPTDDLDTINGGATGDLLTIHAANDARTVVVKHNTGNIWTIGETDISLEDTEDNLLLIYDGAKWCTLGDGGGAGVSDAADVTYTPAVDADWDGGADPGNANDAFDQLAERTTDIEDLIAGVVGASWNMDGALGVAVDVGEQWVMPEACTIVEVIAVVKENGSANSTIVDVNKNGVTLFTTQANRPTIAHDDADNYDTGVPDITAIAQYDEITLDIDAIATDATDLRAILVIEGIGGAAPGGYTEGAMAYRSSNQSIPHNTDTAITFDTEVDDTDTMIDIGGNPTRITFKTAGAYIVLGRVWWNVHGGNYGRVKVRLNGVTVLDYGLRILLAGNVITPVVHCRYVFEVNDYIELIVNQDSGGALNVLAIGIYGISMSAQRVG